MTPRFNVQTASGAAAAGKYQSLMAEQVPYEKRHGWLLKRGWQDLGVTGSKHSYRHPDISFGAMNQTKAVLTECWRMMEQQGWIVRPNAAR